MKRILTAVFLALLAPGLFAQNKPEDVASLELKNGMKILVLEDHSIPNANMYLFWKVGSRNEVHGITGLSHFFEHMMFNGSKKFPPGEFDRVMEANGGSNNAYTTENVTVYTDWFPASSMEVIFDLESDRIANLDIDIDMVESERGVVLSERSTGLENSNFRFLSEQLKSAAFFSHPYMWSVMGYESDIKSWTRDDLQQYFDLYYAPNNCVVVIVGDVTVDQVKKMATQYMEPIPANTPPPAVRTVEPPQKGEKRLTVYKDVSTPNVMMTWHTPETGNNDYYALELLSSILSGGNSARLQKSLIYEQQKALQIFTYQPLSFDPNLFYLYALAAPGTSPKDLESAIDTQLDLLIEKGITDKELQKVKNQKLMEFYHEIETINGKANSLGTYELFFGDYQKLFEAPELYNKVSKEDIQRVAKTYFTKANRTVGYLIKGEEAQQ